MSLIQIGLVSGVAAPFVLAVWAAFMHRHLAALGVAPAGAGSTAPEPARDGPRGFEAPDLQGENEGGGADFVPPLARFKADRLELSLLARAVADGLEAVARANGARIGLAIDPALTLRADPQVLGAALHRTMLTALHATPGGQILVSALPLGAQMHIRVTDDGPDGDQRTREAMARETGEMIALQGGTIDVLARPGRGTTVTLRLPLPSGAVGGGHDGAGPAVAEDASVRTREALLT